MMNPDDELLEELRGMIDRADPPPPAVAEFARAALGWRRLDAELAELLADSALETEATASIRGDTSRRLTFRAGDLSIDLEIRRQAKVLTLLGQVAPPPIEAAVELQGSNSEVLATAALDSLGRFRLTGEAGGERVRLRIARTKPPGPAVETSWLPL
jgi:hypothetical protein